MVLLYTVFANFKASDINSFVVTHLAYIYDGVPNDTLPLFQALPLSQEKRSTGKVLCWDTYRPTELNTPKALLLSAFYSELVSCLV